MLKPDNIIICCCIIVLHASGVLGQSCPRNISEVKVQDSTRVCQDSCEAPFNCSLKNFTCLCDDLCGFSCINKDIECPELYLPFGDVKYDGKTYNGSAEYSCDTGCHLVGPKIRKCQSDGKWSQSEPNCVCESTPSPNSTFTDGQPSTTTAPSENEFTIRNSDRSTKAEPQHSSTEPILIGILLIFVLMIFIGVPVAIYRYMKKEEKIQKDEEESEEIMMELIHPKLESESVI